MPRKLTGGKVGRPLKSKSKILTKKQLAYLDLVLISPGKSQTEYAKSLSVTRAAVSKWEKDGVIKTTRLQRVVRERFEKDRLEEREHEQPVIDELARLNKHKERTIKAWVNSNWSGPFQLHGTSTVFITPDEYIQFLLKAGMFPYDLVDESKIRGKRHRS